MKASDIDNLTRSVIEKAGFGKYFVHSTGHGVGLDIHEHPFINSKSDLIIEDNMENASYIKALLDKTGCSYSICYNGEEAKSEMDKLKKVDLVLLDWLLPDVKGEDLAQLLKDRFKNVPIIVVTALALIEDKMDILETNVDEYIPKPIDRNILMEKINHMMR
jgi:DNA-binding response OmpR family regulator